MIRTGHGARSTCAISRKRSSRTNHSPDVGFESTSTLTVAASTVAFIVTRGPTHEYLGFSAGLDFESRNQW